jgi:hypothetical protein
MPAQQINPASGFRYCCVQGWSNAGDTNIGANPLFADAALRLSDNSPCVDAGDSLALPADTRDLDEDGDKAEGVPWDRDGNPRCLDNPRAQDTGRPESSGCGTVDMGAYESLFLFSENFDAYGADTDLQGVHGWKGWNDDAGASAPVSDALAFSGANSVAIMGSADLVHEFDLAGGVIEFSTMQYIPSGTSGTSYFILLNRYDDGANQDWSVQTEFHLASGTVEYWGGGATTIIYNEWVELKYVIDLDHNTVDKYYNGRLIVSAAWDDTGHNTLGAIDLFANGASAVYYDDITVSAR